MNENHNNNALKIEEPLNDEPQKSSSFFHMKHSSTRIL